VSNFVLIPGAGADPRVYAATIAALGELGHGALAPPLPLEDQDAGPGDHAEAVLAALPSEAAGGPIVVGQSLGAFAATVVAARADAARLILLAPMIPAPGETAGEWWEDTRHEGAIADLVERYGAMSEWSEEAMAAVFYHDLDEETMAANARYEGVPGRGMFAEPLPLEEWPDVPTTVLIPREDRLFPLEFQRRVARERLGLEIEEMGGGHLSMLSRPEELARRLSELSAG
jgi:pimeloyl-ACP methyl ester carboxylesterase